MGATGSTPSSGDPVQIDQTTRTPICDFCDFYGIIDPDHGDRYGTIKVVVTGQGIPEHTFTITKDNITAIRVLMDELHHGSLIFPSGEVFDVMSPYDSVRFNRAVHLALPEGGTNELQLQFFGPDTDGFKCKRVHSGSIIEMRPSRQSTFQSAGINQVDVYAYGGCELPLVDEFPLRENIFYLPDSILPLALEKFCGFDATYVEYLPPGFSTCVFDEPGLAYIRMRIKAPDTLRNPFRRDNQEYYIIRAGLKHDSEFFRHLFTAYGEFDLNTSREFSEPQKMLGLLVKYLNDTLRSIVPE